MNGLELHVFLDLHGIKNTISEEYLQSIINTINLICRIIWKENLDKVVFVIKNVSYPHHVCTNISFIISKKYL